jgi:hypothetical protein
MKEIAKEKTKMADTEEEYSEQEQQEILRTERGEISFYLLNCFFCFCSCIWWV